MQSVWLIILRSGNTRIKWLEMILRIKAQKKFIIFAFKKLHNATYGIFETCLLYTSPSPRDRG